VSEVPDIAWDLVEVADKPLTIIYDKARNLPGNLVAEDGTIAIRITREKFSQELCRMMRVPVVSTSANVSGEPTPRNFFEISDEILNAVDFVVDFRREEEVLPSPSSIIKLGTKGQVKVIR
jgi:L-threonylcarbamoyladenylate synthase